MIIRGACYFSGRPRTYLNIGSPNSRKFFAARYFNELSTIGFDENNRQSFLCKLQYSQFCFSLHTTKKGRSLTSLKDKARGWIKNAQKEVGDIVNVALESFKADKENQTRVLRVSFKFKPEAIKV